MGYNLNKLNPYMQLPAVKKSFTSARAAVIPKMPTIAATQSPVWQPYLESQQAIFDQEDAARAQEQQLQNLFGKYGYGSGGGGGGSGSDYARQLMDMYFGQKNREWGQQKTRIGEDLPILLGRLSDLFGRNTQTLGNQMAGRGLYNSGIRITKQGLLKKDYETDVTQGQTTARRSIEDIDSQIRNAQEEYNLKLQYL